MPTRGQLAKVHIAKRQLNLTDALYREFLYLWFQKRSAKDLSADEIEQLLLHFKGLGWAPRPADAAHETPAREKPVGPRGPRQEKAAGDPQRSGSRRASPAQLKKIEALWLASPGVRQKTPSALGQFLKHYFHISGLPQVRPEQVTPILEAIRQIGHRPIAAKK